MATEATWFPSKVDTWLAVILAVAPLISLIGLFAPGAFDSLVGIAIAFSGPALFAVIYGLLVFPMRYGITRDQLIVRHGVVRQRIELAAIREVEPSSSPLSSPALSLDRLAIVTGEGLRGTLLISPRDREGFLALLAERSGLTRAGQRLLREPDRR